MSEYTLIPSQIYDTELLSNSAKRMYKTLLKYSVDGVTCYPTVETLAKKERISVRTVSNNTKELREFGVIKIYREFGMNKNNVYVIIPTSMVENLSREEVVIVPEAEQYLTEGQFTELVTLIGEHMCMTSLGMITPPAPARKVSESRVKVVDTMLLKEAEGNFEGMSVQEILEYVKYKYKKQSGNDMDIFWARDVKLVNELIEVKGKPYAIAFLRNLAVGYQPFFGDTKYKTLSLACINWSRVFNVIASITDKEFAEEIEHIPSGEWF